MKKVLLVATMLMFLAGSSFAGVKLEYGQAHTKYDGIIAYYGVCVALLSALVVFAPERQSDLTKKFVAVNAGLAGTAVFYKFYFGK